MAKLHKNSSKHLYHFLKVALLEAADPSHLFLNPSFSILHSQIFPPVPFPSDNNLAVTQLSAFPHAETRWDEELAVCIGKGNKKPWPTESVRDSKTKSPRQTKRHN